ncbi:hypothetical protein ANCCEY_08599 [Ancylostoma ceylanicum]|uniref:Secreted protein n=1 Tax=Ancylostoma ceylanicum TaxID=53326 RepID=A0A0D6LQN4_9BILA|nr:hypothetical protein ANCCEY_08599 [Ancylostoma ceylanicum]
MARQLVLLFVLVASVSTLIWPFNKIFGSSNATTTPAPEGVPSEQPPAHEAPNGDHPHPAAAPQQVPPGAEEHPGGSD